MVRSGGPSGVLVPPIKTVEVRSRDPRRRKGTPDGKVAWEDGDAAGASNGGSGANWEGKKGRRLYSIINPKREPIKGRGEITWVLWIAFRLGGRSIGKGTQTSTIDFGESGILRSWWSSHNHLGRRWWLNSIIQLAVGLTPSCTHLL